MIKIYTDGACSQVGHSGKGPGGWASIIIFPDRTETELYGGDPETTNNRMEMMSIIDALEFIKENQESSVEVYSDSAYIVNCFKDKWYVNWRKNGWKAQSGPVKNQDLWIQLLDLVEETNAQLIKVKGHSDNELNNRCDKLAVAAVKKFH